MPIRISTKVRAIYLRQHAQRAPPFLLAVTYHRSDKKRGVLPSAIVWQFIVISQLKAKRPARAKVSRNADTDLQFSLGFMKVLQPFGCVRQIKRPFPVAIALTQNNLFLDLRFVAGEPRLKVKAQSYSMRCRIEDHVTVFDRHPVKFEAGTIGSGR